MFFTSVAGSPAIAVPLRQAIRELRSIRPDCLFVLSAPIPDAPKTAYEADGLPVLEDPSRAVAVVAAPAWRWAGMTVVRASTSPA